MAVERLLDTEHVRQARHLLDQAASILAQRAADMPANFVAELFARADPEDLARYEPQELADLSRDAWPFLHHHSAGTAKVRIRSPEGASSEHLRAISVLEIVNDNMPFLLDSVMGELTEQGISIHLVAHPILTVERDSAGALSKFGVDAPPAGPGRRESFIHIHTDRIDDEARRAGIAQSIERVLADVRVSVVDWPAMVARVREAIGDLRSNPPPLPRDEIEEARDFLEWLADNNFTFLGLREYAFPRGTGEVEPKFETGLGLLRDPELRVLRRGREFVMLTPEVQEFLKEPKALIITKANVRSRVHRRVHMDYVGLKRFDASGQVTGELRMLGLFTSTVYTRAPSTIPYLRRKVEAVLRRSGLDPQGHSGKALVNVLDSYPRDELFQVDEDTLFRFAMDILYLDERPRVRVLPRRDRFDRFVSVLVFVPRERYGSGTRVAIGNYLGQVYSGQPVAFYPFFPEGPLVRVHFIIARFEGTTPNPDRASLERAVASIIRTWTDALSESLRAAHEGAGAEDLLARYGRAFPASYRDDYDASVAVRDIRHIETLSDARPLAVEFAARPGARLDAAGLKVFSRARPIPLSERVPVLENMGFKVVDERTYQIEPQVQGAQQVWLHDMLLERADRGPIALERSKQPLEACFLAVMSGAAENDGYNALVLAAGLPWRDVAVLRTISRFLRQIRIAFSQDYLWATLCKHAAIAAHIVELFRTRFDPQLAPGLDERSRREAEIRGQIEAALQQVESLEEDRILRRFTGAVSAAVRTNFYQRDSRDEPKPTIAMKFESRKIEDMPAPRPLYEVFVYSPRLEAVHLRFGKVARGGIRWSDRPEDFRTEILGLVKAQQVKNAVIVPVGAKGGFLPKRLPKGGPREPIQQEGTAAYVTFISSLLDITDNLIREGVIPPADVVRRDSDDPYLVVAADKGTATFSDIANGIAIERSFWLGDAFASGGSAGFDHKKMGITARGAWEAVRRHFREMDVDVRSTPFTVAGVGDMSGDVFGNGMLAEATIRLVAAFDHRDIFLDPDPDPQKSFAERKRLFELPRSSWQDYDRSKLSEDGGVFSRSAKAIELSPATQRLLGLASASATPQEVMRAILRLSVDLLWFGGIGTYVRASNETDEQVGDKANDPIRVTAADLGCKVIGEGANLGLTQRGRIEAALRRIRLNTDAIDNSAGVNTSDLEVNIKIALGSAVHDGKLSSERRNALLTEMTDEVARLVLRNNYLQSLALSLVERRGIEDLDFQQRLMQVLETAGLLDRAVEFLPDDREIAERRRRGVALTRPELAVLLAYAKIALHDELLNSRVPDDPYLGRELARYFPRLVVENFPDAVAKHVLRRDIIATQLANSIINRGGPTLVVRVAEQTGAAPAAIAAAFAAARDGYALTDLNSAIDALDAKIPGALQLELYAAVQNLLIDRLIWFLRNVDLARGLADIVAHYRAGIQSVEAVLETVLMPGAAAAQAARAAELERNHVPPDLARRIAALPALAGATDVVLVADRTGKPLAEVAATFFAAGAYFQLDRIAHAARGIKLSDYFDQLALDRALGSIAEAERRLTAEMLGNGAAGTAAVEQWIAAHQSQVERIRATVHDIAASGLTVSRLSVTACLLGDLVKH